MENKSPRVSVVMSVYNRAEYAKEALNREKIEITDKQKQLMDRKLMMFYTGKTHCSV